MNVLQAEVPPLLFSHGYLDGAICEEKWVREGEVVIGVKALLYEIEGWTEHISRWVVWVRDNPDRVVRYVMKEGKLMYEGKLPLVANGGVKDGNSGIK